jgi:hypothetical protein
MDRRAFIFGIGSLAASLPSFSRAQHLRLDSPAVRAWTNVPSIVVVAAANDPRLPAVREAIEFWNGQLAKLASPFRLGGTSRVVGMIPANDIHALRANFTGRAPLKIPDSIQRVHSDVIVALSDIDMAKFNPVTFSWSSPQRAVVAIPTHRSLTPGLTRNIMAHEFGHVIGLDHNADLTALMCGGSGTRCQFAAPRDGFLSLTSADKAKVLEMYPLTWEPIGPSKRFKGDPPVTAG